MIFRLRNITTYYWLIIILLYSSCVTIKDYPKGKPFFYDNKVKIAGNLQPNDKAALRDKLLAQIEDTAQPEIKTGVYFFKKGVPITRKYLTRVYEYDSSAVNASARNMNNLLMAQGYFRGKVYGSYPPEFRYAADSQMIKTFVTYSAELGNEFRFNQIGYFFTDSVLMTLAQNSRRQSFIKPKEVFTKQTVNSESDRLVSIFRNNGFFKINRDVMYSVIDTFPGELLNPNLSEFELIQLEVESRKRINNPTVDIEIRQSPDFDSSRLKQYVVRKIVVIPDNRPDSIYFNPELKQTSYKGLTILYHDDIIHHSVLRRLITDTLHTLYSQSNFNQSITNLNRLGVWQSISAEVAEMPDTVIDSKTYGAITLIYRLTPAVKYAYNLNFGLSRNTNNNSAILNQGNFIGLSVEGSRNNRNFLKEGIQSTTNLRGGLEFYRIDTIQTVEASASQSFSVPKLLLLSKKDARYSSQRTFINLSGTYTNRRDFFQLWQANVSAGWEWRTQKHPNLSWIVKPFSLEYLFYPDSKRLSDLIANNPFLLYTFNSGLILGPAVTAISSLPSRKSNTRNTLRVSLEESGYFGAVSSLFNSKRILPYWKLDAEFKRIVRNPKASFVLRVYAGVGDAYGKDTISNVIMPLPKRFVAGGPNSMRAWRLRKLGLGTMPRALTSNDRLGDVQLEINNEYRFNLFPIFGFMLEGALFSDMGNVWVKSRKAADNDVRGVFSIKELYRAMAMDAGAGLRLNFGQFQIRLDWAYTVKDPQFAETNAGWFPTSNPFSQRQVFQFNINYPF